MKYPYKLLYCAFLLFLASCKAPKSNFDASGSFETDETIISAQATGTLKEFRVEEGESLKKGDLVGFIDSIQLYLKKKQLQAQIGAELSKKPDISVQLSALEEQLRSAETDLGRIKNLYNDNAATKKQLDDANAHVEILKKQIEGQRSALSVTSGSISKSTVPLEVQVAQINDQLAKCRLVNPIDGTVLAKYAEQDEEAAPGKPLYKIADVSNMYLRCYITEAQLGTVKLNQSVKVLIDNGPGKYREYAGIITWISDKAEFTPKTIQTKDERADEVYAIKVKVKNDGLLKIGMYGEIKF